MKLHSAVFYSNNVDTEYRQDDKFISFMFTNNVRLGIMKADEERELPGKQIIFIEVDDIGSWYEKVKNLRLTILRELIKEDWITNFSILDPDKNKV